MVVVDLKMTCMPRALWAAARQRRGMAFLGFGGAFFLKVGSRVLVFN
jgi:hypothetical protein